jgi:AcrR family transcriptional regulator
MAVMGSKTADRIIEAARELFDRHGYHSTSVNDIIAEAGVSKPTFYVHFPSKEELCVAYLKHSRARDIESFRLAAKAAKKPMDRFLSPFSLLEERMRESNFRGCRFFNMLSEVVDSASPIAREVRHFNDRFRAHLRELTLDLKESGAAYARLDPDAVADRYYLLFGGSIMFSQEYCSMDPIKLAAGEVQRLVT